VVTTLALIIGLIVANTLQPGAGMNVDPTMIDTKSIQGYVAKSKEQSTLQFLMDIIPNTVVGAFAQGEILQVLFFAILFAFGLQALGARGQALLGVIDQASHALFGVVAIIMKVAPLGAFGAMAFTIGKYGLATLVSLAHLMLAFYVTCVIFIVGVLGFFAMLAGANIFKFHSLHQGGAADRARHLILRIGAAAHDRQAGEPRLREIRGRPRHSDRLLLQSRRHLHLSDHGGTVSGPGDQHRPQPRPAAGHHRHPALDVQGCGGVTGSGFIVLAATLSSVGTIPVAGIALILGVDRFMSEARALTNLIGNGVATLVVSRWEGALDNDRMRRLLDSETDADAEEPERVLDVLSPPAAVR
jgi:aerobic C4-dicarboxylate transport protein